MDTPVNREISVKPPYPSACASKAKYTLRMFSGSSFAMVVILLISMSFIGFSKLTASPCSIPGLYCTTGMQVCTPRFYW